MLFRMLPLPDNDTLIRIAGAKTFKRGQDYATSGAVEITRETDAAIEATVSGQDEYLVRVSRVEFETRSTCTCPAFSLGALCKHVVATTLFARDVPRENATAHDEPAAAPGDFRQFLAQQPAAQLAAWLGDLADENPAIENRLRVFMSLQDPAALRKALGQLLRAPSFLDGRRSRAYARELDSATETLGRVAQSNPAEAVGLYEYALARLFKVYERSDDSGGDIGDRLRQVAGDYLQLLQSLPPGGAACAKALLKLQKLDGWNMLPMKVAWAILSDAGRAAYAGAIESEYADLPPPAKGDRWSTNSGAVHRMEALAEARGDIEALIKVFSRDLSSAYAYSRIVAACSDAGRHREAQQWAERGLKAHPDVRGMHSLVARQYLHSGLEAEACEHFWQEFVRLPTDETWSELRVASRDAWPKFRRRALELLESKERLTPDGRREVSARVMMLLHDGDLEAARALAEAQAMSPQALETLASHLATTHPAVASRFLRRVVDFELPRAQASQYKRLARLIAEACRLAPGQETSDWVRDVRTIYRARSKFLGLLDAALSGR
jgi:tetratricopeptide (TPR) repeat protein